MENRRLCVAVDFDDTLCCDLFGLLDEAPGAMEFLKWLEEEDFMRVLWTCREGAFLDEALAWLSERGFPREWWDAVNDNPEALVKSFGRNPRKIAGIFVDDAAVGFPSKGIGYPEFEAIKKDLLERKARWLSRFKGK